MDFAVTKKFNLYIELTYTELCLLQTLIERGVNSSSPEEKSLISLGNDFVYKLGTTKI